jgi:hypothetical protein
MKEEISKFDDYVDWIQWASDAEEQRTCSKESAVCAKLPTILQAHRPTKDENPSERLASSSECSNAGTRWEEISQKIRVDCDLGEERK